MLLLGLTGDIACGKSTVASMLAERGAAVIDADALVHELYSDAAFAAQVAALFEASPEASPAAPVLAPDGTVDRAALGRLVFADARALRRLEALVHPAVAALRDAKIKTLEGLAPAPPLAVLEAVKLIESGQARRCAEVWCVTCRPALQLQRMVQQRGLSEAAARERLANQPSFAQKQALLGPMPLVILENNGSREALERQVEARWRQLTGSRPAASSG